MSLTQRFPKKADASRFANSANWSVLISRFSKNPKFPKEDGIYDRKNSGEIRKSVSGRPFLADRSACQLYKSENKLRTISVLLVSA